MVGGCYKKDENGERIGYAGDWDSVTQAKQERRDYWRGIAAALVEWSRENDWPVFTFDDVEHVVRPLWDARPDSMKRDGDYQFSAGMTVGRAVEFHPSTFIKDRERNRAVYSVHPDIIRQESRK